MSFYLRILEGKNQGEEHVLTVGETLVGRSRAAKIQVLDADVSGKQFRLSVSDDGVKIYDISTFGTYVDGTKVKGEAVIHSGQVIKAGRTAKFMLVEVNDDADIVENGDFTNPTKFSDDVGTESGDFTNPTRFSDVTNPDDGEDDDKTSVTKFSPELGDDSKMELASASDVTAMTRFEDETRRDDEIPADGHSGPQQEPSHEPVRIAVAKPMALEGVEDTNAEGDKTHLDTQTDVAESPADSQALKDGSRNDHDKPDVTVPKPESREEMEVSEEQLSGDLTVLASEDEDDADADDPGQTIEMVNGDGENNDTTSNGNGTVGQGTVILTPEQIEKIRQELKLKRQRKVFFRFFIGLMFLVCLAAMWVLKTPHIEKELSWPLEVTDGVTSYATDYCVAWDGTAKGGFDLYYPKWAKNVVTHDDNKITIQTYLGMHGEVPLNIIVHRDTIAANVYENRQNALSSALKHLAEVEEGGFYFETGTILFYLTSDTENSENGVPCDIVHYQREFNGTWYGTLTFFRHGSSSYIVRAEVPMVEKFRAMSTMVEDRFVTLSQEFVSSHWEGNDSYHRGGDIDRQIFDIRDELMNHDSERQYAVLELKIKGILAQTTYNKLDREYAEALELLKQLRYRQKLYYNRLKIRWNRSKTEKERENIYRDGIAVFSLKGDKRNYDITRGVWE